MRRIGLGVLMALAGAQPAHAEAGDVLVRLRGILVAPTESSSGIQPSFPNEEVSVSNHFMPEVDFTYMATDHIGFELILATTKHEVSGTTGVTGGIGDLASSWVLPPTLTVQYHPFPNGPVRPYVGAGANYTIFYSEDASRALEAAVGRTSVRMSDSFGWAVQAGVDLDVSERVFLNFDVKYIDMDSTARLETAAAGTQRVRISIDPIVVGVGIGMRF
jgi:outer membrane protein